VALLGAVEAVDVLGAVALGVAFLDVLFLDLGARADAGGAA